MLALTAHACQGSLADLFMLVNLSEVVRCIDSMCNTLCTDNTAFCYITICLNAQDHANSVTAKAFCSCRSIATTFERDYAQQNRLGQSCQGSTGWLVSSRLGTELQHHTVPKESLAQVPCVAAIPAFTRHLAAQSMVHATWHC